MKNQNRYKIEQILKELKINYDFLDLEDDDINYSITFNTSGSLKKLNSININGILYLHHNDFSLNFIIPNIYVFDKSKENMMVYDVLNATNCEISYGKFLIYKSEDKREVYYSSSINCGNEYELLNTSLVKTQLDMLTNSLSKLLPRIIHNDKSNE